MSSISEEKIIGFPYHKKVSSLTSKITFSGHGNPQFTISFWSQSYSRKLFFVSPYQGLRPGHCSFHEASRRNKPHFSVSFEPFSHIKFCFDFRDFVASFQNDIVLERNEIRILHRFLTQNTVKYKNSFLRYNTSFP